MGEECCVIVYAVAIYVWDSVSLPVFLHGARAQGITGTWLRRLGSVSIECEHTGVL